MGEWATQCVVSLAFIVVSSLACTLKVAVSTLQALVSFISTHLVPGLPIVSCCVVFPSLHVYESPAVAVSTGAVITKHAHGSVTELLMDTGVSVTWNVSIRMVQNTDEVTHLVPVADIVSSWPVFPSLHT